MLGLSEFEKLTADPKKNISYKDMQYLIITQGNVI